MRNNVAKLNFTWIFHYENTKGSLPVNFVSFHDKKNVEH
jgi:hypothetical protein